MVNDFTQKIAEKVE